MPPLIDKHNRERLTIEVQRKLRSGDVQYAVADAMLKHETPRYIRSDNGPEFIAKAQREWFERIGAQSLFIKPG